MVTKNGQTLGKLLAIYIQGLNLPTTHSKQESNGITPWPELPRPTLPLLFPSLNETPTCMSSRNSQTCLRQLGCGSDNDQRQNEFGKTTHKFKFKLRWRALRVARKNWSEFSWPLPIIAANDVADGVKAIHSVGYCQWCSCQSAATYITAAIQVASNAV